MALVELVVAHHRAEVLADELARALRSLLGIGVGWVLVQGVAKVAGAFLPGIFLSPESILTGIGLMLAAGVVAGVFPAMKAMRLSIVDALARG